MDDANVNVTSGATVNCHTVNFQVGSITRIAFGFSSVTTGGTPITHNLGALPFVFITPSTNTNAWVSSTTTTTQFTAFVGANTNCWWLAIA